MIEMEVVVIGVVFGVVGAIAMALFVGLAARVDDLEVKADANETEVLRLVAIAEQHDGWMSRREGSR